MSDHWEEQAFCQGRDPELWFSETPSAVEMAKLMCSTCPVKAACLEYALASRSLGIWGGTTEEERADMLLAEKRQGHRNRKRKTHCKNGHRFSGANVYVRPDGSYMCRTCTRVRKRKKAEESRRPRPTHCRAGHLYTPESTYVVPTTGSRVCRICRSAWKAARKQKARVAA